MHFYNIFCGPFPEEPKKDGRVQKFNYWIKKKEKRVGQEKGRF